MVRVSERRQINQKSLGDLKSGLRGQNKPVSICHSEYGTCIERDDDGSYSSVGLRTYVLHIL